MFGGGGNNTFTLKLYHNQNLSNQKILYGGV